MEVLAGACTQESTVRLVVAYSFHYILLLGNECYSQVLKARQKPLAAFQRIYLWRG
jgi:hypothetical protein